MTGLQKMRKRFTLLVVVFLAVDAALIAYLLWPAASPHVRDEEERRLHADLGEKMRDVAPLTGIDDKLTQTRVNIKKFMAERILGQSSQISNEIHRLARENGVTLQGIRYKFDPAALPNLQKVEIDTGISGDYLKIAHFVNAVERDKLLFVINQVTLSAPQGGAVQLQIKFQTFLKEAA